MAKPTLEVQFHGTVVLATLHLRRLAKSNDIEEGLSAARDLGMIDEEKARFMRECLALDEKLQVGAVSPDEVSDELVSNLQRCILSINSADPA